MLCNGYFLLLEVKFCKDSLTSSSFYTREIMNRITQMTHQMKLNFHRLRAFFSASILLAFVLFTNSVSAQLSVSVATGDIGCFGLTADDTINATGGSNPYTYTINSGTSFSSPYIFLAAGTYTVVVTDNLGATASTVFTHTQPADLVQNVGFLNPGCAGNTDGSAWSIATGGIPFPAGFLPGNATYNYDWYDSATNTLVLNDSFIQNINSGVFYVVAEDFNGCRDTVTGIRITQPDTVVASITSMGPTCFGGNNGIALGDGTGGITYPPGFNPGDQQYIYDWYDASTNTLLLSDSVASGLSSGTYYLVVEDFNGCRDTSATLTLNSPTAITASGSVVGTTVTGSATGGTPGTIQPYTWQLDNGTIQNSNIFTGVSVGTHSL
ncbi:MAG: hypothetical protein RL660_944, partial [Bacteroidota bacterium]